MKAAALSLSIAVLALLAAPLAGCAPQVVHAAPDGISFTDIGAPSPEMFRVAKAHCQRYGKRTQYEGIDSSYRTKFQCVE